MTEGADFDPGPWRGHDFKNARKVYDDDIRGRSYAKAKATGKTAKDYIEPTVSTQSRSPLVIISDVTGSMGAWPATIFSKLPYLEIEARDEYLGVDLEICFAAVGDAYSDDYPLQVRPFTSGTDLAQRLKELNIEGGGGNQTCETYELAALYFATQCEMPNATNPILIFIGDESPYDVITADHAEAYVGVKPGKRLTTKKVFEQLKEKFAVYLIRKPYGHSDVDNMDATNKKILADWTKLLGSEHIATLPSADRVVDVIFGILAKETERVDYFKEELEGRQNDGQVKTVYKSLKTVHLLDGKPTRKALPAGASRLMNDSDGKATESLI